MEEWNDGRRDSVEQVESIDGLRKEDVTMTKTAVTKT